MPRLLRIAIPLFALSCAASADERDQLKVGVQPDGRIVVPTNQILQPAGKQVTFPGRPVDLLLIDDGKTLVAKNMRNLVFIDVATGTIKQTLALPAAAKGLSGAFSAVGLIELDGRDLRYRFAERDPHRQAQRQRRLRLGRALTSEGAGRRRSGVPDRAWRLQRRSFGSASSRGNEVQLIERRPPARSPSACRSASPRTCRSSSATSSTSRTGAATSRKDDRRSSLPARR